MPHVAVKMLPGRSEDQKARLAQRITDAVMAEANSTESDVSVSIEEIAPDRWTPDVYTPDIAGKSDKLYKKPGYTPG